MLYYSPYASVAEWSIALDCKSGAFGLRRFESFPAHHMLYHNFFGWVGAFLFAICAVPQVMKTWQSKSAHDLSMLFLLLWIGGELFSMFYILIDDYLTQTAHYPIYLNYSFNIILVLYLVYAKKFYK